MSAMQNTIQRGLAHITAAAVTPDQLLPYVAAVSACRSHIIGDCICHVDGADAVLVAYPLHNPLDSSRLDAAVRDALALPGLARLTVIAPVRPSCAPLQAVSEEDAYWVVDVPAPAPKQKLGNMLRRAAREVSITQSNGSGAWTPLHEALVREYIRTRPFAPGTRHIFGQLGAYLHSTPQARLFSAYTADGGLAACAIGDFSALSMAFYMFAFRQATATATATAPPGTSDALLWALLVHAAESGHSRCNLGLGIGPGVAFFKKKWQAYAYLPCVQTTWTVQHAQSWLARWLHR